MEGGQIRMTYEIDVQTTHEAGHVIFVYKCESHKWYVIWRMVIPSPSKKK